MVLGPGGVDARGIRVTGLGAPLDLDVRNRNGATSVRAKGTDVDVQRIVAMTGIRELRMLPEGSRASFDVDVNATPAGTDGHVDVTVAGAKDGTAAELHATFAGRHASVRSKVTVGLRRLGRGPARESSSGPMSLATLKRATGALDLRGELDLAQGAALFGGESIEQVSGRAFLSARIERFDPHTLPTVYATARTRDLDVTFNREGKSTHMGGIDGSIHVGYDGAPTRPRPRCSRGTERRPCQRRCEGPGAARGVAHRSEADRPQHDRRTRDRWRRRCCAA